MKKLVLASLCTLALALGACKKEENKPTEGQKAALQPGVAEQAQPAAGGGGDLPPACKEYTDKMTKCIESDKYPAAARDAAKQGFAQMKSAWNFSSLSGDSKKQAMDAADNACKQAIGTMKQASEAMCPGIW